MKSKLNEVITFDRAFYVRKGLVFALDFLQDYEEAQKCVIEGIRWIDDMLDDLKKEKNENKNKVKLKPIGIRRAIELFGGTDIEIKKNYHYQSGFFVKDGQLYYINTGDDRMLKNGELDIYYRTAKDRNDFTGGPNLWGFNSELNRMGYSVCKFPKAKERN